MAESAVENALLGAWRTTLARCGPRPAVLAASGAVLRTFADIEAEAETLARSFGDTPARSVVAVQLGNSPRWPAVLLALFRRTLIPLPLGRHMERAELDLALATCGAAGLLECTGDDCVLRAVDGSAPAVWSGPAPDFLKLTSGTTSAPRAVRFRAHQLVADCDHICDTMGITERDLNYGAIPFSHSYGFSNLLTPLLCRGVSLVATEDRMPRAILDGLARTRATVFPGMPVFFQKFAEMENTPALPALRLCISAGAPLPPAPAERFTARFGMKVHTFYGSSECGGIGYDASEEPLYEEGYVGTAMHGVRIGRESDEPGPIAIRGAAVGDGYFPEDDPSLADGRFIPGDLIRWTPRGMFLAGRTSDIINIAGRKLNPLELEARLAECPGVRQAVVFGVLAELRGEEPVVCVAGEGLTREAVLRFCHERLSAWQVPRAVWIVADIPVNERGKISRRALAQQYLARTASL